MANDFLDIKSAQFLRSIHSQVCFENGEHKDEVSTAYSDGADAIEQSLSPRKPLEFKLEWDSHPDGEGFYAFPNGSGDSLYVVDLLESGRWRLFIGGGLVRDGDCKVRKWDDFEGAMAFALSDLQERINRLFR